MRCYKGVLRSEGTWRFRNHGPRGGGTSDGWPGSTQGKGRWKRLAAQSPFSWGSSSLGAEHGSTRQVAAMMGCVRRQLAVPPGSTTHPAVVPGWGRLWSRGAHLTCEVRQQRRLLWGTGQLPHAEQDQHREHSCPKPGAGESARELRVWGRIRTTAGENHQFQPAGSWTHLSGKQWFTLRHTSPQSTPTHFSAQNKDVPKDKQEKQ